MANLSRHDFLKMLLVPITLSRSLNPLGAHDLTNKTLGNSGKSGAGGPKSALVPLPKVYRPSGGTFKYQDSLPFNTIGDGSLNNQTIRLALGGSVRLARKPSGAPLKTGLRLIVEEPAVPSNAPESYKLRVQENQITISSRSSDGLLMGLRSLAQLAIDGPIPLCEIEDWPDTSLRAAHLCYHLVRESLAYNAPNFEALIEQIDQLAALKYNSVLLELESMFPYKRHPLVSCKIAFTPDQIAAIRDRLKAHHMQIIPMVQCLGHAYNVLIHEQYASYRELPDTYQQYCPTNPKLADLYMEFVDEYLERFPGIRQWHMGGDESQQIGLCPRCKSKAEEFGKSRVYVDHVSEIARRLRERGLIPMLWSDMLEAHPEELARLPKDIKIVYWNYDMANWNRPYAAAMLRQPGFQVIGAPAVRWGSAHTELSVNYQGVLRAIETFIRRMHSEGSSEFIVTSWTKGSPHENAHYGFAAASDACWNASGSGKEFDKRYAKLVFGTDHESICSVYELLSLKVPYAEGMSWHEWNHLNRFDLSGFRFPEKWKRYTSPEKEPQALDQLRSALEASKKARAILDQVTPQCPRGKRQLQLLLNSAQCILAKAQFALALHTGHKFSNLTANQDAISRWLGEQPQILAAWREAQRVHWDTLVVSGFAPAVKFLNELMFEPIEYDALAEMGRHLASKLESGQL